MYKVFILYADLDTDPDFNGTIAEAHNFPSMSEALDYVCDAATNCESPPVAISITQESE